MGNVVGSKATSRASGSSMLVASGAVIVDDMTVDVHAAGQRAEHDLIALPQR
jgi:hypothetical protein